MGIETLSNQGETPLTFRDGAGNRRTVRPRESFEVDAATAAVLLERDDVVTEASTLKPAAAKPKASSRPARKRPSRAKPKAAPAAAAKPEA